MCVTYLLVEDDDSQATLLKKFLIQVAEGGSRPVKIEVLIEDNLEAGLRVSNRVRPNATFLDLLIPLRKGEPPITTDQWRRIADHIPEFVQPVIITTGMDIDENMRIYCITERGAHDIFRKPFDNSFFARLRHDSKIFAAQLLQAASSAELRSARTNDGQST